MADPFQFTASGLDSPARHAFSVTPSDSVDLTHTCRAVYVGGAGDLSVVTAGGDEVTLTAVPAGSFVPVCVQRVNSTDTTATNIVALW